MKIILNIGLNESEVLGSGQKLCQFATGRIVEDKLAVAGAVAAYSTVVHDEGEDTLITHVNGEWDAVVLAAQALCVVLAQDCIAVGFVPFEGAKPIGALVGPRAAPWGEFDPDFFKVN